MSRTFLFLGLAATLALVSLVAIKPAANAPVAAARPEAVAVAQPAVAQTPRPTLAFVPVTAKDGSLRLETKLSSNYLAQGLTEQFLEVSVTADETKAARKRVPVNLVVVLDRSGSMAGQKLAEAQRAAKVLVEQLGPNDRLAVVDFGSDVRTLESQRADAAGKARLNEFIDGVRDNGSTNIALALGAAQKLIQPLVPEFKASRIIFLSDGQPTEGVVDAPTLAHQVEGLHENGLTVSAIGVGVDFNGALMRELADKGAGFYGFIDDAARLAEVFRRELDEAGQTVARNLELELELPAGVELVEVYGREAQRVGTRVRLPLYDFSPGQSVRLTAKLNVRSEAQVGAKLQVAQVHLSYTDLAKDARVASAAAVEATVTDDPALARSVDAVVKENADRAEIAKRLTLAAAAYEAGDRVTAFAGLDNIRSLFGASADALGGESIVEKKGRWANAKTDDEVRSLAKGTQLKSIKDFGNNNAY
jgi:Ca-activated chloride channel family protein